MTDPQTPEREEIPPGPFVKVYGSIVYSSVWRESKDTRLLWITMLAIADEKGYVRASVGGLADLAKLAREECVAALEVLKAPDPDSKDKSNDGRRIVELQGGWRVLNKERYRDMRTPSAQSLPDGEKYSPSYVYYAVCGTHCKIGVSKNPWARVADMKTVRPEIRVAVVEMGDQELESQRHQQFAGAHIDREWFQLTPELQAHIDQLLVLRSKARRTTVAPVARPEGYEEIETEVDRIDVVRSSIPEPPQPNVEKSANARLHRAIYLTTALNKGMAANPAIGDRYNPVIGTSQASYEAAETLEREGIDLTFAWAKIYDLAKTYKPRKPGDQIRSLSYLTDAVVLAWQQEQARKAAADAPEPPVITEPSAGNGNGVNRRNGQRDAKGVGLIIFGQLRNAVREVIRDNVPGDPGAGNRLVREIPAELIGELVAKDPAAGVALNAIGGAPYIARANDETLGWKFAAAYAAAAAQ